jgi:hypothetical protein
MTEKNGAQPKRQVLVVGGEPKNVPTWAARAFEIEHVTGMAQGGNRRLPVKKNPEAIVVIGDHVSHNFSGQAHDLGRALGVPVLKARSGWATAVAGAAKNRLDWFVDAVQRSGESLEKKNPPRAAEAAEAVENAWKETAQYERDRYDGAGKRLRDVQTRLDKVEHTLERVRSGAQERVLSEIKRRASEIRAQRDEILRPIAKEVVVLSRALVEIGGRLESIEGRLQDALRSPPSEG